MHEHDVRCIDPQVNRKDSTAGCCLSPVPSAAALLPARAARIPPPVRGAAHRHVPPRVAVAHLRLSRQQPPSHWHTLLNYDLRPDQVHPTGDQQEMGDIYVVNGFYATMQADYVEPGASIYYYSVQWDAASLSWEEFRSSVLGATDPSAARAGSLRRDVLDNWEELGLAERPNIGRNAVHGSASPLEALVERLNWLAASIDDDETAGAIMDAGVKKDTLLAWAKDPQVEWEGASVSLFDAMEDLSVPAMLKKAQKLGGDPFEDTPKFAVNQAFLFIKPHAVNDAVKEQVRSALRKHGIAVVSGARRASAAPRIAAHTLPSRPLPRHRRRLGRRLARWPHARLVPRASCRGRHRCQDHRAAPAGGQPLLRYRQQGARPGSPPARYRPPSTSPASFGCALCCAHRTPRHARATA